jgi:predicted nucleotidyltransferase
MQLRELTERGEDPAPFIPESAMEVFRRERDAGRTRNREKLEIALLSRLYALRPEAFDTLPDAGGGAGRRLYKALREEDSLERAVTKASNKRYTAARMRRMLLSAALGLCADDTRGLPPYARLLALSGKGRDCLAPLRGKASVPLLNRPGAVRRLGSRAERAFSLGAEAHALYRLQFVTIDDRNHSADWKKGTVLVQNR